MYRTIEFPKSKKKSPRRRKTKPLKDEEEITTDGYDNDERVKEKNYDSTHERNYDNEKKYYDETYNDYDRSHDRIRCIPNFEIKKNK